jgi:mannan endo-1,4-beta-mannosidase
MDWDELRDEVSKFYTCAPCKEDYLKQVDLLLSRTNSITKKKYKDDPTIMSWELANEPRPMRSTANEAYVQWIQEVAAFIKSKDRNHLVTLGHEGNIGVDRSMLLYEKIHALSNVDYLTIHIWPKNWSWFKDATSMEEQLPQVLDSTIHYINAHIAVAQKLKKPLVIEEFGLPRDGHSFDPQSTTSLRDRYYDTIFSFWMQNKRSNGVIAGANFWAFGGAARPKDGQAFWKMGDDYMGDPPMEEQGLNTVFDSDTATWRLIRSYTRSSGR